MTEYRWPSDRQLARVIEAARHSLQNMAPYQRRRYFAEVSEGYCKHCGAVDDICREGAEDV